MQPITSMTNDSYRSGHHHTAPFVLFVRFIQGFPTLTFHAFNINHASSIKALLIKTFANNIHSIEILHNRGDPDA